MTAQIINGKEIAQSIRAALKEKIARLASPPMLAVIMAGDDPASAVYIRAKEKACNETGIIARTFRFPATVTTNKLAALISELNADKKINGILVQLPLPAHLNTAEILNNIAPQKDVDGFHPLNAGLMLQKHPEAFIPCTPKGIICLLKTVKTDLSGLTAVVIGRSQIVGLPTAHLLINENCTVTIAHSKTKNLPALCRTADILVVAAGKPEFITKEYIKPDAVIIDVGINRTKNGIKGDVLYADALQNAAYITPVPGGVGPMTIAMLLENTFTAFLKQNNS